MGQAKRRGTYEQRQARAIELRQAKLAEDRRIRAERQRIEDDEADRREAAMTPAQKRKRLGAHLAMAQIMALARHSLRGY